MIGLTIIQVLAIALHAKRGESGTLPTNAVLIVLNVAFAILIAARL